MFSAASFMSYATSKKRNVLSDIYNYEMSYSFISSCTFADSLWKAFRVSTTTLHRLAETVGLCRTSEVCVEFVKKQSVFAQSVPPWCQLWRRTRHPADAPKQKTDLFQVYWLCTRICKIRCKQGSTAPKRRVER
jgi:hypothetical protein